MDFLVFDIIQYIKINSGASFCQVDKMKQFVHLIISIVIGYQWWHGAAPSFIIIDIIKIILFHSTKMCVINIIVFLSRNIVDPRVWAKK